MREMISGLGFVALFGSGVAFAQNPPTPAAVSTSSGGIPVGPLSVFPSIELAQGYDDNLFWTRNNRKSSSYTVVSPQVRAEARSGPHAFGATLRMTHGSYWSSSSDNFTNYSFVGDGDLVFSGRSGLRLRAEFNHAINPRGSTDLPLTKAPDQYNDYGLGGVFRYGAPGAQGRIEIDSGAFARRYTNNHSTTDPYNRNTWQLGGTFFWRAMPRTEVLVQAQHRDIHYTDPTPPSQSSTENRYYLGLKWDATAKTTGTVKFGYLTKNFDSSSQKNYSGTSWDAGVRWSPLTYSVFDFTTSRQTQESTGVGDAILSSAYGVSWNHAWNSRFRTQGILGYRNDDFIDSSPHRKDDTTTLGIKAFYSFRRWLLFGAEYTHFDRNSNLSIYDYKRNLYLLTIRAEL